MVKKEVALVECRSYEPDTVLDAVERLVSLLGGWGAFVRPGENIVVKPNLLMKKPPEEAVTTHPAVVEAVARGVARAGWRVILADSPGGLFKASYLRRVYEGCGMAEAAARSGAALNFNTAEAVLKVPAGGLAVLIVCQSREQGRLADGFRGLAGEGLVLFEGNSLV